MKIKCDEIKEMIKKDIGEDNIQKFFLEKMDEIYNIKNIFTKYHTVDCMCSVCYWFVEGGVKVDKHHFCHRQHNGNNSYYNLIHLCPNCHRLIHHFEKELFYDEDCCIDVYLDGCKNINDVIEEVSLFVEDCLKNGQEHKHKKDMIRKFTDILIAKLIYILFFEEEN